MLIGLVIVGVLGILGTAVVTAWQEVSRQEAEARRVLAAIAAKGHTP